MRILLKLIFLLSITLALIYCKESPILSTSNPLDPESDNYVVTSPSNLNINAIDEQIEIIWEHSEINLITGFELYYSYKDTNEFMKIAELAPEVNSFIHTPADNPIHINYRLSAFYDKKNGRVNSVPIAIDLTQEIYDFNAFWDGNLQIEFSLDHSFYEFSRFTIEQRIGRDSEFQSLATFPANTTLNYQYNSLPSNEVTYRVYVENDYERTEYIESKGYGDFEAPQNLRIIDEQANSVEIAWVNYTEDVDEFILVTFSDTTGNSTSYFPGSTASITFENLDPTMRNDYDLFVRKGGFYSGWGRYFQIYRINNQWELSTEP